jgi:GTP-binding protein Era
MVGQKVSIISTRPQTTRNVIRGVLTGPPGGEPEWQLVILDTPGVHRPRTQLGERLNRLVTGTLEEVDAALFVIDATEPVGPGDRLMAEKLISAGSPVVVAVNKVDIAGPAQIAAQLREAAAWDFAAYIPVSATTGLRVDVATDELAGRMPEGPAFFPPGTHTDQAEELLVAEIIREKFLDRLREELPHSLAVRVRDLRKAGELLVAEADLVVERPSQQGIVIGRGGSLLQLGGSEARAELEALFETKVHLALRVVVEKDWQQRPELLERMGF